ncbi:hypothetical protein Q8W71_02555 [Methylobacterium sp. NEAU 140]|uniref:hypothetical protein n=1 Tax=Methylobacterium sp. NEAU 140 TaxID=3064945 RepID=UPI0027343E5E|nr:hypothetical protein [Methylobacterium sp. NEAU 140]MDP4021491.1 hypothetical protein [Methylobacterium sp. NEAU 140]
MTLKSLIAAAGLLVLAGVSASAQEVPVPIRPQGFVFVAPDGPSVLESEGGGPLAPASRPDLQVPAVPVPQVMNGGGFGFSGFDYYNDQISEGRFGAQRRPKEYVVAPAYIVPPRN